MAIKKAYVDTRDGQVHYQYCKGGNEPPIVFFHQTASSSQSYEKIMSVLDGKYHMVAMDTPGFGQTFFPQEPPTVRYYVSILLEALENMGTNEFHAFGHHTGAVIAVEMAGVAPSRVRTLMLDGPVYFTEDDRKEWLDTQIKPMIIKPDGSHLMEIWERVVGLDPEHPPELCHREAIDTLRAGQRWHEAYIACLHQDYDMMYSRVQCPMLLLCGDNDVLFPYFKPLCDKYPDANSVVLNGAGTYAPDNHAEHIVDEIQIFLNSAEGKE